ncbi:MAG: cysteine desulfurase NifS [Acidobacteria bacterium]|nr:MAG: cysteine desulfurase NifS [Acidobacteriota bacterium]
MKRIYLDNSATTAVDPEVLEAMWPYFSEEFGNASSVHTVGQKARAAVEAARARVAELIGAQPGEIVFTSGGTESDNLAIKGVAEALSDQGRHIITSAIEHPAVLRTCRALEKRGFRVTFLPVSGGGLVEVTDLEAALREDTILVSIMMANNEIGTRQPIEEIGRLIRDVRQARGSPYPYVHTDAVQAVGKVRVDVNELGVDLLSLSAHKIHGPKGVGALYVRSGVLLAPQMHGGHHERDRRAGTENVPGIVGFGRAAELARTHLAERQRHMQQLRDHLEEGIARRIPDVLFNGDRERRVPHISNCSFRYIEGEALMIRLDLRGIAVSTGSACASGSVEPSHVLTALGRDRELARGSIRFSLCKDTTASDIDTVLDVLVEEVAALRALSPLAQPSETRV